MRQIAVGGKQVFLWKKSDRLLEFLLKGAKPIWIG
jgi:hypothetical protein